MSPADGDEKTITGSLASGRQRRAARRKRPHRYNVYVVELDDRVWNVAAFGAPIPTTGSGSRSSTSA